MSFVVELTIFHSIHIVNQLNSIDGKLGQLSDERPTITYWLIGLWTWVLCFITGWYGDSFLNSAPIQRL